MAGRPSLYSEELAQAILDRLADGESMRSICRDEDMPDRTTVRRWEEGHPEFAAKYARAREHQGDAYVDDMADLAEELRHGSVTPEQARILQASLEWRASKLNRKRYGNVVKNEHTGEDGGPIKTQDITVTPKEAKAISQALDDEC